MQFFRVKLSGDILNIIDIIKISVDNNFDDVNKVKMCCDLTKRGINLCCFFI